MNETFASVEAMDFHARGTLTAEQVLSLELSGNADLNVKVELDRFLHEAHTQALRVGAHEVRVDVRSLEFMNSSCLKGFVNWILSVQDEPAERQYRIVFISGAGMQWQRRSLHALSCFASDLVTVQV